MSATSIPIGSALAKKVFGVGLFSKVQAAPGFMNMLSGNFGSSFYTRRPVIDEIAVRIGPTLLLFGSSVVISYLLGIFLGAILAWRRGSKMELSSIVVSLFFYSMPVFWFGLVLLWFFAFTLKKFPLQGIGGFDPSSGAALCSTWGSTRCRSRR